jgi:hypothetical protein
MTKEEAVADFRKRIAQYESIYETISEPDMLLGLRCKFIR